MQIHCAADAFSACVRKAQPTAVAVKVPRRGQAINGVPPHVPLCLHPPTLLCARTNSLFRPLPPGHPVYLFEAHVSCQLPHQLLMLWVDGCMLQHHCNAADAGIKHTLQGRTHGTAANPPVSKLSPNHHTLGRGPACSTACVISWGFWVHPASICDKQGSDAPSPSCQRLSCVKR